MSDSLERLLSWATAMNNNNEIGYEADQRICDVIEEVLSSPSSVDEKLKNGDLPIGEFIDANSRSYWSSSEPDDIDDLLYLSAAYRFAEAYSPYTPCDISNLAKMPIYETVKAATLDKAKKDGIHSTAMQELFFEYASTS